MGLGKMNSRVLEGRSIFWLRVLLQAGSSKEYIRGPVHQRTMGNRWCPEGKAGIQGVKAREGAHHLL